MEILIWIFCIGIGTVTITGIGQEKDDKPAQEKTMYVPEVDRKN